MSQGINKNPYIKLNNWKEMLEKGWRWAVNLPIRTERSSDEIDETIDQYTAAHGEKNVTIGNAFNPAYHAPIGDPDNEFGIAIYVRDVEVLVRELRQDIKRWEEDGVEFS